MSEYSGWTDRESESLDSMLRTNALALTAAGLGCLVAVLVIVAAENYLKGNAAAKQAEQAILELYNTIPTPTFSVKAEPSPWSYHKLHFAGVRATYLSRASHTAITDYYFRVFTKLGWRVCIFDDHSPYHEPSPIFEKGNLDGSLVFMRASPESYTFDLGWTDDPSPNCSG